MAERRARRTQAARREEAEQKLLDAAAVLLTERGYDGFTLADVGERAGYSRGLPAHYYGKKDALLAATARHLIDQYRARVVRAGTKEPGLPDLVSRIRIYASTVGSVTGRAVFILLGESASRSELRQTLGELNKRGTASLASVVQAGVDAGNIRPDVDAQKMGAAVYSFLRGQMMFAALDSGFDVAATTEQYIETLQRGLGMPAAG